MSGKSDPRMACGELRAENVSEFRSVVRSLSSCLNLLFWLQFPVILLVLFSFGFVFLCEGILIVKSCGKWSGAAESSAEEGKSMKSQECA